MALKRLVLRHTDGLMEIVGVAESEEQPPTMLHGPVGPINLVASKRTYCLYKPLMLPAGGREEADPRPRFDPRQR